MMHAANAAPRKDGNVDVFDVDDDALIDMRDEHSESRSAAPSIVTILADLKSLPQNPSSPTGSIVTEIVTEQMIRDKWTCKVEDYGVVYYPNRSMSLLSTFSNHSSTAGGMMDGSQRSSMTAEEEEDEEEEAPCPALNLERTTTTCVPRDIGIRSGGMRLRRRSIRRRRGYDAMCITMTQSKRIPRRW